VVVVLQMTQQNPTEQVEKAVVVTLVLAVITG
jgi:hypothetical protein